MHLLIVGCGYLGMRVAESAVAAGDHVSALTRSPERAAAWRVAGIEPVIGDVLSPETLAALPAADACLYAVGFDRSASADKRSVYVQGLRNVLHEIHHRIGRLIYVSSTSVYGQQAGEWVNEDSPCEPDTDNGRICLDAERVVSEYSSKGSGGLPGTILRLSGIYGPGRLIARQNQLLSGTPLQGNPDAWMNLIHVDDAVQAVQKLLQTPATRSLYLLSDERPLQRQEFYRALAKAVGGPEPVFQVAGESGRGKRCDSRRIRSELNLKLLHPEAVPALTTLIEPGA